MDELLERTLKEMGKTRAEFDAEVEEEKQGSSVEAMGNIMAMLIQNADMAGQMVGMVMLENEALKARVGKLEGAK